MENTAAVKPLKLNYKRTMLIGFAFFGILLLWQVYDSWCPTFLSELFKNTFNVTNEREVQYLVGIMMAIDNLAALILLYYIIIIYIILYIIIYNIIYIIHRRYYDGIF